MTTPSPCRHRLATAFTLCLCLLAGAGYAGPRQDVADLVRRQLPRYGEDSLQYAATLNRISALYLLQDLDSSRHYAAAARMLSRRLNYTKGLADACIHLGACFTHADQYARARRYFDEGLRYYRRLGDSAGISMALAGIGTCDHRRGSTGTARPLLQEAFAIGGRLLRDSLWAPVLISYYQAFAGDSLRRDSARLALRRAYDIAVRYHDRRVIAHTRLLMAREAIQNRQPGAAPVMREAVQEARQAGLNYLEAWGNAQLDRDAVLAGQADSIRYREAALDAALRGGYTSMAIGPATSLFGYYERAGSPRARYFARLMQGLLRRASVEETGDVADDPELFTEEAASGPLRQAPPRPQERPVASLPLLFTGGITILSLAVALVYVYRKSKQKNRRFKEVTRLALSRNRELMRQDDFKGKLLSIISHDFRLPLSQIISITDLFKRSDIPPEHFREMALSISATANETLVLFETVLNWVRSQLSGFEYVPQPHAVKALLEEAAEPLSGEIRDKAIRLDVTVEAGLTVLADREMLQFVNRNLLHNAVKYARRGSRIVVAAAPRNDRVSVSVTNEGSGIQDVDVPYIFSHRVPGTLARETGRGAGLALIICKDFIERMGGSISVRSDGVRYATFEYIL